MNHNLQKSMDLANEKHHSPIEHDSEHANHGHEDSHAEHVCHQIHNRPYAALYVAAFFFDDFSWCISILCYPICISGWMVTSFI